MVNQGEVFAHIDAWRDRLHTQTVISASEVQGRLFDLYGDLEDVPAVERIKPWLTLTVQRQLFGADEVQAFLDDLQAELGTDELEKELNSGLAGVGGGDQSA
jgi:hypothetical protein